MFIAHIPIGLCLARLITKRKLTAPIIAIAAFGAIFPDLDLLRFYVLDNRQIHHHAYWTHLPAYWVGIIATIFMGLKLLRRRFPMFLIVFFAAVISHFILDSVAGDIRWLWPFSDEGFQFVTVPSTHTKWYMSNWRFVLVFWPCSWQVLIMDIKTQKSRARLQAKQKRAGAHNTYSAIAVLEHFPAVKFRGALIGGYWPLSGELDIRPLLGTCHEAGHSLSLPTTPRKGYPLTFRRWTPAQKLKIGPYNTREPFPEQPEALPSVVLVPLLAFTKHGERLGYGGGFYDRTLAALKAKHDVFACGVAYAAQEAATLPTDHYDHRLDGMLTEKYFKTF